MARVSAAAAVLAVTPVTARARATAPRATLRERAAERLIAPPFVFVVCAMRRFYRAGRGTGPDAGRSERT